MTYQPERNSNNRPNERNKNRIWMVGGIIVVLLLAIALFSMNGTDDMNELTPAAGQENMAGEPFNPSAPQNNDTLSRPVP